MRLSTTLLLLLLEFTEKMEDKVEEKKTEKKDLPIASLKGLKGFLTSEGIQLKLPRRIYEWVGYPPRKKG